MIEQELTGQIIKVFYKVYNTLGYGFIESIYHNAMIIEITKAGYQIESEGRAAVYYDGRVVGAFAPDLIVDEKVILELKAKERIVEAH